MPFWTLLLAWLVLGERVQESRRLAVALASAGFYGILNPFVHHESLLSK
jgi:drug/metabolite transporter (DMT)-like permease